MRIYGSVSLSLAVIVFFDLALIFVRHRPVRVPAFWSEFWCCIAVDETCEQSQPAAMGMCNLNCPVNVV